MSMTPEELSQLRELCEKATAGPWETSPIKRPYWTSICLPNHPVIPGLVIADARPKEADFIAASRTALPQLLDEVERAREEVGFQMGIVRNLNKQVAEWERMRAHWTSRASKAEAALNEATKLLDQTIEVLEKERERTTVWFEHATHFEEELGTLCARTLAVLEACPIPQTVAGTTRWWEARAKPLLDNLKARKP